jgi:hypothetical protein
MKRLRHGGRGPASGNGNSKRPAERPAAPQYFHASRGILGEFKAFGQVETEFKVERSRDVRHFFIKET